MEQGGRIAGALRVARENLGLSVEQAASSAGVPLRYARLLEGARGPGTEISDPLYLIPFFRRYANCLGLRAEDLLPDFLSDLQETSTSTASQARLSYRSPLALLWKPAAIVAAVAFALVLVNRRAHEHPVFDDELSADVSSQGDTTNSEWAPALRPEPRVGAATADHVDPTVIDTPTPALDAATESIPTNHPPSTADLALAPEAADRRPKEHELHVVATEDAWLAVGVDETPAKAVLLHPGESRTWTARVTFTLTTGNAGGITVVIDGSALPRLGRSGQVVRGLRLPQGTTPAPNER